jgi:hypothetical protein
VATLHIEHPITDLGTWLGAFARFEQARQKAGVRAHHVRQPVDDDKYIYVDLDFGSVEQAAAFRAFLETKVWASEEASPGLAGTPRARVLTDVDTARPRRRRRDRLLTRPFGRVKTRAPRDAPDVTLMRPRAGSACATGSASLPTAILRPGWLGDMTESRAVASSACRP